MLPLSTFHIFEGGYSTLPPPIRKLYLNRHMAVNDTTNTHLQVTTMTQAPQALDFFFTCSPLRYSHFKVTHVFGFYLHYAK